MATMAAKLVTGIDKPCLLLLDAYFAVGPVFEVLKRAVNLSGQPLVHVVTRAKNNIN